jgi:endonuclease YncB( thermonuclease family)
MITALIVAATINIKKVVFEKAYDGDTITVNIPYYPSIIGKHMPVRLEGIDAPEIGGKNPCESEMAIMAKNFVANKLLNAKKISLKSVQRDKFFRLLAIVEYDGNNLSSDVLLANLAVPYFGKTKEFIDWCIKKDLISSQ